LHSATLLHDDLIDDAETRRGKEAAFRKYGNAVSPSLSSPRSSSSGSSTRTW
ncbi:polyprenyl synthetase family protein, partial [Streptococcus pneumoniae]